MAWPPHRYTRRSDGKVRASRHRKYAACARAAATTIASVAVRCVRCVGAALASRAETAASVTGPTSSDSVSGVRALRRFTVRAVLPEQLAPLAELVNNLRWSWHGETRDLFAQIDPDVWEQEGGDPTRLLGAVPSERLEALARDRRFLRHLSDAAEDLRDYVTGPRWY